MTLSASVLYFNAPHCVEVRDEPLNPPCAGELQIKTLVSAISPGTEMLFFRGQIPADMSTDATLPDMDGLPTYPLRYGYACVGEVIEVGESVDSSWLARRVFAFHPHASHFNLDYRHVLPVPVSIHTEAAALFPTMETALTFAHDAATLPGERILVFGQGVVGLVTTWLLAAMHPANLVAVDPLESRRKLSPRFGAHVALTPDDAEQLRTLDPDLILELTGNPRALRQAVELAGFHSRIIIGSWYGTKPVELPLGHSFHRNRITIYGSQVSTLPAHLTGRWSKERRYAATWQLLETLPYAHLISQRIPIRQAQSAYQLIEQNSAATCQVLLTYDS